MADEQNLEKNSANAEVDNTPDTIARSGKKPPKVPKAAQTPLTAKSRRFSKSERAAKLAEIDAQVSDGIKLRTAIKQAGISAQTYYQWIKLVAPPQPAATQPATGAIDTLDELIGLDGENQRLRVLLAEKLRVENAELRKRLGMR